VRGCRRVQLQAQFPDSVAIHQHNQNGVDEQTNIEARSSADVAPRPQEVSESVHPWQSTLSRARPGGAAFAALRCCPLPSAREARSLSARAASAGGGTASAMAAERESERMETILGSFAWVVGLGVLRACLAVRGRSGVGAWQWVVRGRW
jgi:hypothetical protein